MPKKTTASQRFAQIFALFTNGTTQGEREAAERKMDQWLKRHGKTRADIASILVQAAADNAAAQPTAAAVRPARCCVPSLRRSAIHPDWLGRGHCQHVRYDGGARSRYLHAVDHLHARLSPVRDCTAGGVGQRRAAQPQTPSP